MTQTAKCKVQQGQWKEFCKMDNVTFWNRTAMLKIHGYMQYKIFWGFFVTTLLLHKNWIIFILLTVMWGTDQEIILRANTFEHDSVSKFKSKLKRHKTVDYNKHIHWNQFLFHSLTVKKIIWGFNLDKGRISLSF